LFLQERCERLQTTWILNALAQIDGVETADCMLLQQSASLAAIMRASAAELDEGTVISSGTRSSG
jgi:hypothetical protein